MLVIHSLAFISQKHKLQTWDLTRAKNIKKISNITHLNTFFLGVTFRLHLPMLNLSGLNEKVLSLVQNKENNAFLFSATLHLNAFVKNAVIFFKLIWFTNAAICIAVFVNQNAWFTNEVFTFSYICKSFLP